MMFHDGLEQFILILSIKWRLGDKEREKKIINQGVSAREGSK